MASRPKMPLWVRDYAKYRKLYRHNGPFIPITLPLKLAAPYCAACRICKTHGVEQEEKVVDRNLWVCKECLTVWHIACARMKSFQRTADTRDEDELGVCPFCGDGRSIRCVKSASVICVNALGVHQNVRRLQTTSLSDLAARQRRCSTSSDHSRTYLKH